MKNRGAQEQEIVLKTDQMTVRDNKLGKFFGPCDKEIYILQPCKCEIRHECFRYRIVGY